MLLILWGETWTVLFWQSGSEWKASSSVKLVICDSTENRQSAYQLTDGLSDSAAACLPQDNVRHLDRLREDQLLMKTGLSSLFHLGVKIERTPFIKHDIGLKCSLHVLIGKRNKHLTSKLNARISGCILPFTKQVFCFWSILRVSLFKSRCKLHLREVLCKLGPGCNEWLNQRLHGEGCRHQTIAGLILWSGWRSSAARSSLSKPKSY